MFQLQIFLDMLGTIMTDDTNYRPYHIYLNKLLMKKISIGRRHGTMLLDHALICVIGIAPISFYHLIVDPKGPAVPTSPFEMMPFFVIYFCKDCIGGRSLAKRILKLVVIDNQSNHPATSLQTVIRNLFVIVWPIEVFVSFFNQERRIGDRLARTKLAFYEPAEKTYKINTLQFLGAILLAAAFTFLLMSAFTGF